MKSKEFCKINLSGPLKSPKIRAAVLTLTDQMVHSGSSFVTGILVGRLLSLGDFGAFSLGLSLFVFSLVLQDNLLATPYTYRFHNLGEGRRAGLRAGALVQALFLALGAGALLILAALVPAIADLRPVLWALAFCLPFLFLRECLRRLLFTEYKMGAVLALDTGVSLLQFLLIYTLWMQDLLSPGSVFAALAAAAGVGAAAALVAGRAQFDFRAMTVREDTLENILYGRWLLAGSLCHLGSLYAYPWLIFALHGKAEAGAFAACYTLVNLLNPLILGFNNYFRPKIIQTRAEQGIAAMDALVRRACLLFVPAAALIILFLGLTGGFWIEFIYGPQFAGLGPVIGIVSLSVMATVLNAPLQLGTLALNRPQLNPVFHAVALAVTVSAGVALVLMYGKTGAAAGYALAATASVATLAWLYKREVARQSVASA